MSNPLVLPEANSPVNWPEPDNNYVNTCRSCELTFFGPKRAPCCHACFQVGMQRRKEGEAAYEEEHKEPRYGFDQTALVVYREGWISGWQSGKNKMGYLPRQKGEVDMETVIDIRAAIIELMGTGVKVPTTEELIAYMATSPSNSNP